MTSVGSILREQQMRAHAVLQKHYGVTERAGYEGAIDGVFAGLAERFGNAMVVELEAVQRLRYLQGQLEGTRVMGEADATICRAIAAWARDTFKEAA